MNLNDLLQFIGLPTGEILAGYWQWPWLLGLLLLLPVLGVLYRYQQKQQLQRSMRFSAVALLEHLKTQPPLWKRLLFPVCLCACLACLILAVGRPTLVLRAPVRTVDMMLVMDISISMRATDIRPDRVTAAREAAIRFVRSMPKDVRLGLEYFAGEVFVLEKPTQNHAAIINHLQQLDQADLITSTKIGSALEAALQSFSVMQASQKAERSKTAQAMDPLSRRAKEQASSPEQKHPDRVIVLVSDGDSYGGFPLFLATRHAKERRVTVYTIGIGSVAPTTIEWEGQIYPVSFNERSLISIAEQTGGRYFRVMTEADFHRVYETVREKTLHFEERVEEVTYLPSALAGFFLMAALFFRETIARRLP